MMFNNHFVVAIKSGGKVLRESKDIYLPFGCEYSIYLKNLNTKRAAVSISIDGKDVLNGSQLVIEANSELNLERFLESNSEGRKFKFIERTSEIEDHRGVGALDGVIRVEYQYEQHRPWTYAYPLIATPKPDPWWEDDHHFLPKEPKESNRPRLYKSKGIHTSYTNNTGGSLGGSADVTPSNAIYNVQSQGFASNAGGDLLRSSNTVADYYDDTNDAGITVKGSKSYQSFTTTSLGIMESQTHVITLQLKGEVGQKPVVAPVTVKTRKICPSCGRTYKGNIEFCPHDGTFLELTNL